MASAHFAEVIDLDDLVLGKVNSLAWLDSDVSDTSDSLVNQIVAGSSIGPIVNHSSQSTGDASTEFVATYQLHEPNFAVPEPSAVALLMAALLVAVSLISRPVAGNSVRA